MLIVQFSLHCFAPTLLILVAAYLFDRYRPVCKSPLVFRTLIPISQLRMYALEFAEGCAE